MKGPSRSKNSSAGRPAGLLIWGLSFRALRGPSPLSPIIPWFALVPLLGLIHLAKGWIPGAAGQPARVSDEHRKAASRAGCPT